MLMYVLFLSNKSGDITENQDINYVDLGEIIPRDVTGEMEILRKDDFYDALSTSHTRIEAENAGLLLLSGYHWVPREDYYWSTTED
ncbi:hypothetical protein NPIL_27291 [Nephila pilipes]|uniref:Uncharacterized protein n=1 Tax=Nephila pilipes TaxID=299642 RepID=A0A8X6NYH4_NEPPI|nr:hypothetical protein NPIL_27291 [Nephila pilipes]